MRKTKQGDEKRPVPELRRFIASFGDSTEREAFAKAAGTSLYYLYQISCGDRKAGHDLAKRIETASKKKVRRHHLRPDIWDAA